MFTLTSQMSSVLLVAACTQIIALLGFLFVPPHSLLRTFAVAVIVILVRQCLAANEDFEIGELFRLYMCGYVLYANEYLVLETVSVPASLSTSKRLLGGLRLLFSPRMHVPPKAVPRFDPKNPSYVPTRKRFFCLQVWKIGWMATAYYCVFHRYSLQVSIAEFAHPREHLFRRLPEVDGHEAIIRIYMAFKEHFRNYVLISLIHSTASLIGVFLFKDEPADWRPLYGNIEDAYTVRRYYSHFWHRVMRTAYVSNAKFVLFRILGVPSTGVTARLLLTITALAISGTVHSVAASTSWRCATLRPLWYYLSIGGAILIEDMVQHGYWKLKTLLPRVVLTPVANETRTASTQPSQHATGKYLTHTDHSPKVAIGVDKTSSKWRYVGYLWVMAFECWAIPRTIYPQMTCQWVDRWLALNPGTTFEQLVNE
ncbi:hypothetical protein H2200_002080 [Cladophialophora chaetospira]|uniref:Wax synthase domain-containing protein n=1 Tax=Cladophialophora chaetospira TaxID=386627 RepID=A0AA39CMQ2_9EURO|nr:hypothetical protein H2200_002080 [Cladophialophora chaetospira]